MDQLSVENLQVFMLNQYSLNYLLDTRVRKQGVPQDVHGPLTFELLEFVDDATVTSINNLLIDDLVFLKSQKSQDVLGHKIFSGNLTLIGPSTIQLMNDYELLELYKSTIFRDQDHFIDYMQFPALNLTGGLLVQHFINQRNINYLLDPPKAITGWIDLVPQIKTLLTKIEEKSGQKSKEKRFLYIDHNPLLQIVPDLKDPPPKCLIEQEDLLITPHQNQIVVKSSPQKDIIEIANLSVNFTIATNLAEGQCDPQFVNNNLKVVWGQFQGDQFFQNFSFARHIVDVQVIEPPSASIFMILLLQDRNSRDHSIVIQELKKATNDWEESARIESLGNFTKINLIATDRYQLIVVCAAKASLVLQYDRGSFKEVQRIATFFDLFADLQVDHHGKGGAKTIFLLMARKGAKALSIYKFAGDKVVMYQELTFESTINGLKKIYIEGKTVVLRF